MATLTATRMTADEFLASEASEGYELVHGVPEEIPVGTLSAWVAGKLFGRLDRFLEQDPRHRLASGNAGESVAA